MIYVFIIPEMARDKKFSSSYYIIPIIRYKH